jgi:hypothetical protein
MVFSESEGELLKIYTNAVKYSIALDKIDNHLRSKIKYEEQESINIQELRTFIKELRH